MRIQWDFFNLSFEGMYKVITKNERFYTSMVCYLRLFELMHQIIATLRNTSAQLHTSALQKTKKLPVKAYLLGEMYFQYY